MFHTAEIRELDEEDSEMKKEKRDESLNGTVFIETTAEREGEFLNRFKTKSEVELSHYTDLGMTLFSF